VNLSPPSRRNHRGPGDTTVGPFTRRSLISLLQTPELGGPIRSHETGTPERVVLLDLPTGQHMLPHIPVKEEHALARDYDSIMPWTCEFDGAEVFGPFGIICVGGDVVADTLAHTGDHCETTDDEVRPYVSGVHHVLPGTTLSLLGPFGDNYYHWTIDGLGRLAAADAAMIEASAHLLVPPLHSRFQHDGLALAGLANKHIVEVDFGDRIEAEHLLLPCNMAGEWRPHPRLRDFFLRLGAAATPAPGPFPPLLYIDRRGSANRLLANEEEVIAALARYGFIPVRLEALSLAEQIGLFANARVIVGPHGAGLTNILFARPGCALIELQMSTYVHWIFRLFAAMSGVYYDCVIGKQVVDNYAMSRPVRWIDHQVWAVSITHMLGAVEQALSRP
jgi:capsular polysaccharide biosynthesis protein